MKFLLTQLSCSLLFVSGSGFAIAEVAQATELPALEASEAPALSAEVGESAIFSLMPVGLVVRDRTQATLSSKTGETLLVLGAEDGRQAQDLEQWLLPLDGLARALQMMMQPLEDGGIELRSLALVKRIEPGQLTTDGEMGLAFSVAQLREQLGVEVAFDLENYALELTLPWEAVASKRAPGNETPVVLEGLPRVTPAPWGIAAVAQSIDVQGRRQSGGASETKVEGELTAIGSALGGAWYVQLDQPELGERRSWQLEEAQYLRQGEAQDWAAGSQQTFWSSAATDDYWGLTTIRRWGFEAPDSSATGGFSPQQRLQAESVGREIAGEAEPGTLVQLTQGLGRAVVDEVLVDSSGLYRFEQVPGSGYQLLLYPDGQLTAEPVVRRASFTVMPGQLPAGGQALILSGGFDRQQERESDLWGSFDGFQGGIAYRRGLGERLTLGAGLVHDDRPRALLDGFYQPTDQLDISLAALASLEADSDWDATARASWRPNDRFRLNLSGDRFSQRYKAQWRTNKFLTLTTGGNSRDGALNAGARVAFQLGELSTYASALVDTNLKANWSVSSRWNALSFDHRGNDTATTSALSYQLGDRRSNQGHELQLDYETREVNDSPENLASVGWHYRSGQKVGDGRSLWNVRLGYGLGSQGQGAIAQLGTAIIPGLDLRLRYEGISAVSNSDRFTVNLTPRLRVQPNSHRKLSPGDPRQEQLRQQGGLLVQPFLDQNGNGQQDSDEPLHLAGADELFSLNHRGLHRFRSIAGGDGVSVPLEPASYRLDLDPAGLPLDWTASETAYAVTVVPGQYTQLKIPLSLSYTVTGVVRDEQGQPLGGAKVEAVHQDSGQRQLSVTNGAGVYYLESLTQGDYSLYVNDVVLSAPGIRLDGESEPYQALNLQMPSEVLGLNQ